MGVSSSLYASISGLSTMGEAMSVLGDNVANVNTVAFKSSRSTFQDVLSQSVSTAAGSAQLGRGVTLSTISGLFAQGSFESSSSATDLAIGGQGFFMLRSSDSTEADMYTRAGEFQFDQEGFLVNPVGDFAQGWSIDSTTGEREGTIGDISIGKNTPPVATKSMEVIANLDSRKANETNEDRLFSNWNGTNANAVNPSDPIDSTKYDYTTAIKIYDSKGASHDISVYFDRTTNDNEWEFLVTSDPTEDLRVLSTAQQEINNPDTTYNYKNHKGAGALLYGTLQFDTSGNINQIDAFDVPPDGMVDPEKEDNRVLLSAGDSYFSFDYNFTGASTNDSVTLNFGARYEGQTLPIDQVLVSDAGGVLVSGASASTSTSNFITTATLWSDVADSSLNAISQGDTFILEGFTGTGSAITNSRLVYTVDMTKSVQDFLDKIDAAFGGKSTIDADGRLVMTDTGGGPSAYTVTRFDTYSANQSKPFGGTHATNSTDQVISSLPVYVDATQSGVATSGADNLDTIFDAAGIQLAAGDIIHLGGQDIDGVAPLVVPTADFTIGNANMVTVNDLLTYISDLYDDGSITAPNPTASSNVTAVLDSNGNIRVIDNSGSNPSSLVVSATITAGSGAEPWGFTNGVAVPVIGTHDLSSLTSFSGQINVNTSKKMLIAGGRATSTNTGAFNAVTPNTTLDSVFAPDGNVVSTSVGLVGGQQIVVDGKDRDGNTVSSTLTVPADPSQATMDSFLSQLTTDFKAEASIDNAGRLVLTDWVADSVSTASTNPLAITSVTYNQGSAPGTGLDVPRIFGTSAFDFVVADLTNEDGSKFGDTVTIGFEPEALSSTQYANSSTTIFQDQNGFASGFLQSVSVDVEGVITGHYSNGQVLKKAEVALANFSNLAGLRKEGGNIYTETTESGAPVTGAPGTNGLGSIAPNALEQSNVDLGAEFVKLITVQRGFQANSKIITTTDDMLNDLINIKR